MAAGVVIFCEVLLLVLPAVSVVPHLSSIDDLKRIGSGQSASKQALMLLHWFAHTVDISNGVIYLTFNPNSDFGSHHYGNYDGLLPTLYYNANHYYTVGNIHQDKNHQLPNHIRRPPTLDLTGNSARIIFRVQGWNSGRYSGQVIDEVYITQHQGHAGSDYDPRHTYRITTGLLRQIRNFPMNGNDNSLRNLRDQYRPNIVDDELRTLQWQWRDLAALGLLFIVLQRTVNQESRTDTDCCCCFKIFLLVLVVLFAFFLFRSVFCSV